jgi:hypothetical protein
LSGYSQTTVAYQGGSDSYTETTHVNSYGLAAIALVAVLLCFVTVVVVRNRRRRTA